MHFRFRRYRAFLLGAAVFLFLLYRLSATTDDALAPLRPDDGNDSPGPVRPAGSGSGPEAAGAAGAAVPDKGAAAPDAGAVAAPGQVLASPAPALLPSALPEAAPAADPAEPDSLPHQGDPAEDDGSYGRPGSPHGHAPAPSAAAAEDGSGAPQASPSPTVIHWVQKARDHFPVPEDSVMVLPTGAARPIPRIQHRFADEAGQPGAETDAERAIRLARLASVRSEMQHAWTGYRAYAWGHDELKPVSKGFRDPFCGWAATLVDGLDTLWIMGLRAEFDDAYEAVKRIDFTTTPHRPEIPVFETIIRYLGGLLGAYDVSGGPAGGYPALLTKAVELADILMDVFDTPNRMPVLYYDWRPAFASQRKTAAVLSGVAEMGTMSLEFTRLAQLTGNNRYYDAIARITDALEEYQNRGTALPGLLPKDIDASGCNRTTAALEELVNASLAAQAQAAAAAANTTGDDAPTGYQPSEPAPDPMQAADLVRQAENQPRDPSPATTDADGSGADTPHDITKRDQIPDDAERPGDEESLPRAAPVVSPPAVPSTDAVAEPRGPLEEGPETGPLAADGTLAPFQCIPMNLTAGSTIESYSMGGGQDSAYEYFPKQYLLLGGLVTKYRTMHEKVIEGVKKYLLYRPVIPDQTLDILFSAVATSHDGTDAHLDYTYEVPHLTCFLGGMFAMGGRIFDRPEDIEIGRQLTDGCVWAYDSTPSGLMPEFSIVLGCRDPTPGACAWNETAWYRALDSSVDWRANLMRQYETDMEEWKRTKAAVQAEIQRLQAQDSKHADEGAEPPEPDTPRAADPAGAAREAETDETAEAPSTQDVPETPETPEAADAQPLPLGKRDFADVRMQIDRHVEEEPERDEASGAVADSKDGEEGVPDGAPDADAESQPPPATPAPEEVPEEQPQEPQEPQEQPREQPQEQPPPPPLPIDLTIPPEPTPPLLHQTFVRQRIDREGLPPGFVGIGDRRYILRPEAIESVWYMYRITGERQWQDKGWRMFEAVVRAAKTEVGHSAVGDVTGAAPAGAAAANQQDSMESFWLAETLKYYYLLFAEPDVISLDEWVLNTEAHPFRRPT